MEAKEFPTPLPELEALRERWTAERDQASGYLAVLEAGAGRALLEGRTSHREALASARTAVNEANEVLAEIARQMPQARALALQEQAKGVRKAAGKLIAEAEGIESQVAGLLDQIELLEGARYVPPPSRSRFGPPPATSQRKRVEADKLTIKAENLEFNAGEILKKAERGAVPQWQA